MEMKWYRLRPRYWFSRYFGFGLCAFAMDILHIKNEVGEE